MTGLQIDHDLRIDHVVTMPGAVRSARTYSLVLGEGALYVVDVGPAMGPRVKAGGLVGVLANKLASVMIAKVERKTATKVAEGIAQLDARGHEAMAGDKGSHTFRRDDIRSCDMGLNAWGTRTLKLKTAGQNFAFDPELGGDNELEAFGEAVRGWANLR